MSLRPYPEYKEIDLEWLEHLPTNWDILRGKAVFEVIDVRSKTGQEEKLTVSSSVGVVPRSRQKVTMFEAASYVGHKLCWEGDLVINSLWAWMGGLGFAKQHGLISSAYSVYRPKNQYADYWRFYDYLLRSIAYNWEFRVRSKGVWTSRLQLLDSEFLDMPIIVPPPDEQAAIVTFLDAAEKRIRRYIRVKQKLIKLLNEQKQAIIQQAVTRGLDPDVPMKDSGVEWLGEIPVHWEVAALGLLTITRCDGPFGSGLKSTHYTDEGVRVIRLQNIGNAEFRDKSKAYISPQHYATLGDHDVLRGDLLIAGLGDGDTPAGRACVAPEGIEPAMVKADCFRFRLRTNFLFPMYVALQLSSTAFTASAILSTGATRQRINLSSSSSRSIAFPGLDEQNAIVSYIFEAISPLDETIDVVREEIRLIGEYRTRLIADVVTGKVDVRGMAFEMPEAFDESDLPEVDDDELFEEEDDTLEELFDGED